MSDILFKCPLCGQHVAAERAGGKMTRFQDAIARGIPDTLPNEPAAEEGISHAPARVSVLSPRERALAVRNALRYFPTEWHRELASEFVSELDNDGRTYMRRFRPHYEMVARPIDHYPARSTQAAAIMLMIQNNLDKAVALARRRGHPPRRR